MTAHISARIAWHMDGWNGHICKSPEKNSFCVGEHSFPGDQIKSGRRLDWEMKNRGKACSKLDGIPPCAYSINAFGEGRVTTTSNRPDWYPAEEVTWDLPASTICIWPYEQMYRDEVHRVGNGPKYDHDKRRTFAEDYFAQIEPDNSLVFYYANYSNPFSEDDAQRYVVVGMSRVKTLGEPRYYERMTPEDRQSYGGGFVWARDLTSHYPDEGLRLPYHAYPDDPDAVSRFMVVPPNSAHFKYATRQFSDDDALELVELLVESAGSLREMGDTSEDWSRRLDWLHTVVGTLWSDRGLYPGVPAVLGYLGFAKGIRYFKKAAEAGDERQGLERLLGIIDGTVEDVSGLDITAEDVKAIRRRWNLLDDDERRLLAERLVRFDLKQEQVSKIVAPERSSNGITVPIASVHANPYVLAEQFAGESTGDTISFTKIDHGMIPSPELGGEALAEKDDWRRLRGLCVEHLRSESADVFLPAAQVIHDVNHRLSFHPEWKRHQFTERYLDADREDLEEALVLVNEADTLWLYLRQTYDDERLVESVLRDLSSRNAITLNTPMTERHWFESLREPNSPLVARAADEYAKAIKGQAEVCADLFRRPLCVLAGEAGTGKTTVVGSLISAIERTDGAGISFQLLAPTGKAAERLREKTSRREETVTIHSFLAKRGWLNDNMTFKREGGVREDGISTVVIDEASMLSLELTAALFRAIKWNSVKRLILVGDPSQLPPIGRGRVFADVLDHLRDLGGVGELSVNVRQMENRVADRGTAILELADAFVRSRPGVQGGVDVDEVAGAEEILKRVQEGGDVDKDLRVLYWRGGDDLRTQLLERMTQDAAADTGLTLDPKRPWEFWRAAFDENRRPDLRQVLTPYRGEVFGTESLNGALQGAVQGKTPRELNALDGVVLGDKVIQVKNRPASNAIWAYCWPRKVAEKVEVYNGELGFVSPHAFDAKKSRWAGFRPSRFQVRFSAKPDHAVGYGSGLGKKPDGKGWMPKESVEGNLELAYAISVHKAQGSEFDRVYFVVPKHKRSLLSRELFYTGLTRAGRHCTLLIEEDISPLLSMRRLESSRLARINASLFAFQPVPNELRKLGEWYEEGKIHSTLTDYMVRSKSEVIIANMLFDRDISFRYEEPLFASDGTFYLPDFTIVWQGHQWYWEHLGRLDLEDYKNHWETKKIWYERFFPGQLVITEESGELSNQAAAVISQHFS